MRDTADPSGPFMDRHVKTLNGDSTSLEDVLSPVTLLNFWAPWCGPCKREVPELVRLEKELGPDTSVVGLTLNPRSSERVRSFAEEYGINYALYRQSRSWARQHFRIFGMPTTLLIVDGTVQKRLVGPQTAERLREALVNASPSATD